MTTRADVFMNLPSRVHGLGDLAENLWWCWHPSARMLFKMLNRQAWKDSGHNPDKMLKELPSELVAAAAADPTYLRYYDVVMARYRKYMTRRVCELLPVPRISDGPQIAYFSAEYGLHHSLPFYAGGLGFLAGDHLKECSDLNLPLVAVGFMYPEGYLKQRVREDGWQEKVYEHLDRDAAPINRVTGTDGRQLVVRVPLIEPPIHVAVWRIDVGRVPLFLMDTDIDANEAASRGISARLYIGDLEKRLRQEIVLGLGGAEILEVLGIRPRIVHLNEGHAAFALLEQIRDRVDRGAPFAEALQQVRERAVFTTHTPVPAGHDVFPTDLMAAYFGGYWPALGIDRETFMRLGAAPGQGTPAFNMTALALRLSAFHNAVSRRHAEVSQRMWQNLWPGGNGEIDHVTNGVHVPTWIDPRMRRLFDAHLGEGWLAEHDDPVVWELVERIPDEDLWRTHYWLKIKLIDAIRERSRRRWAAEGVRQALVLAGGALLDPSVLTFGFARRFAAYKRADLILSDPERLKRLLNDPWRPIQIIFAGKAHPDDTPGKEILQRIFNAARDPQMGGRLAFVEDYGEQMAQYLVHGVDVWLNTPVPPMEASGTSGMKAALNGVPQLSVADGWWIEGFDGQNGWSLPSGPAGPQQDAQDAAALYEVIAGQIVPLYYSVADNGIPPDWVRLMKATIKRAGATFSARRMVKQYSRKYYARALEREA